MGKGRITLDMRPVEERKEIARKGAIASNKAQREKKEKLKQRKTIVETLKDVLYSNVTNKKLLKILESSGIKGEQNYLVAMVTAAVLKGVQKGNLMDIMKSSLVGQILIICQINIFQNYLIYSMLCII
jgi:hypothetical protein